MAIICPTVTASTPENFRRQMERVASLSSRVHIDLMDGVFTPHKSVGLESIYWTVGMRADIHLMYKNPMAAVKELIKVHPALVIIHAEADGNFHEIAELLRQNNIQVGLALLQRTKVADIEPVLDQVDHVLVFSGTLGSFGGHADEALLDKVRSVKVINPGIEVGWDGGINDRNAHELIQNQVDVLDIGGFIHRSDDPAAAYAKLESIAGKTNNG